MSKKNGRGFSSRKTKGSKTKKSKYTKVEQAAYLQGLVDRGLKNPDSRISASYTRGLKKPEKREKKSLFYLC